MLLTPRSAAVLIAALVAAPALALTLGPQLVQADPPGAAATPPGPRAPSPDPLHGFEGMLQQGIRLGEAPDAEPQDPLPDGPGLANLSFAPRLEVDAGRTGAEPGIVLAPFSDCAYVNAIAVRSMWRKCPLDAAFARVNPPAFVVSGLDSEHTFDLNGNLWYSDLWLGSAAVTASRNAGGSWAIPDYLSLKAPVDDRQWLTPVLAPTPNTGAVIQVTNQIPSGITINLCLLAPPPDSPVVCAPTGYAALDAQRFCVCPPGKPATSRDGVHVVIPYYSIRNINPAPSLGQPLLTSALVIEAAVSHNAGLTWNTVTVATNTGDPGIFPVAAFDAAGNAYVSWAAERGAGQGWDVWLARSFDEGASWDPTPVKVSAGGTNALPWLAAGAEGHVALAWYHNNGTEHPEDAAGAWHVEFAQSTDAHDSFMTVQRARASPLPVHMDDLSVSGLQGSGDRDLLDFLGIALDTQGLAHLIYSDDHTDGHDGHAHVYYVRQTS